MRIPVIATMLAGSLALAGPAMSSQPLRDRFPVAVEFESTALSDACGTPVTVAIDGTFDIKVFHDHSGATVREIDTQPGTLLTYRSATGEITVPFSGVLHTEYFAGVEPGAPVRLVMTGNSGPFAELFDAGSGRLVLDGVVVFVEDGFVFTRFTELRSASGNFTGQVARICAALT
ncbi:MAG TPA: hypothetical protein VE570_00150 [Thermoleophilaceae bacterium]|jgi:hypothetical protein|nr:hypothetical protein [Thermoleophilaceae bacterium]